MPSAPLPSVAAAPNPSVVTVTSPLAGAAQVSAVDDPFIDPHDLGDPSLPLVVLQAQDLVARPMKVVGDIGYLLVQPIRGVAHHSPVRPVSTSNDFSQCGQVTDSRSWPLLF